MKKTTRTLAVCLLFLAMMAMLAACAKAPVDGGDPDGDGNPDGNGNPPQEDQRAIALTEARDRGLFVLVNKENPVGRDEVPGDLSPIEYYAKDRPSQSRYMRAEAAEAFNRMAREAAEQGIEFVMTTAYRSYDFQKQLYHSYVARHGEAEASRFSAKPGQSEHQTGLAVDVSSASVDYQLVRAFGESPEGLWLADHAMEYGFIIRYPEGAEDVTGYLYEPWHLRYVGVFAAKEIHEGGLIFEDYLELIKDILDPAGSE